MERRQSPRVYTRKSKRNLQNNAESRFQAVFDHEAPKEKCGFFSSTSIDLSSSIDAPEVKDDQGSTRNEAKNSKKGTAMKAKPKRQKKPNAPTKKAKAKQKAKSTDSCMFMNDSLELLHNDIPPADSGSERISLFIESEGKENQVPTEALDTKKAGPIKRPPARKAASNKQTVEMERITNVCEKIVSKGVHPLTKQMAVTDKVKDWFARSSASSLNGSCSDELPSIEVMREETHPSRYEGSKQLFSDDVYASFGGPVKPKLPPLKRDAKKGEFLAQLRLSPVGVPASSGKKSTPYRGSVNSTGGLLLGSKVSISNVVTSTEEDSDLKTGTDNLTELVTTGLRSVPEFSGVTLRKRRKVSVTRYQLNSKNVEKTNNTPKTNDVSDCNSLMTTNDRVTVPLLDSMNSLIPGQKSSIRESKFKLGTQLDSETNLEEISAITNSAPKHSSLPSEEICKTSVDANNTSVAKGTDIGSVLESPKLPSVRKAKILAKKNLGKGTVSKKNLKGGASEKVVAEEYVGTKSLRKTLMPTVKRYTSDFFGPEFQGDTFVEPKILNYLSSTTRHRKGGQLPDFPSEVSAITVEPKILNYLSSTTRHRKGGQLPDFPSEVSAITDSWHKQKLEEQTPQMKHAFTIPSSPIKPADTKVSRKGILQPKNSTQLFTTGFVEISDAFPQISSIRIDPSQTVEKVPPDVDKLQASPVTSQYSDRNHGPLASQFSDRNHAPVKTSTPCRSGQKRKFNFEIDLSSVKMDSEDGEEDLLFHQSSREVNSEEILHLSQSWLDPNPQPALPLSKPDDECRTMSDTESVEEVLQKGSKPRQSYRPRHRKLTETENFVETAHTQEEDLQTIEKTVKGYPVSSPDRTLYSTVNHSRLKDGDSPGNRRRRFFHSSIHSIESCDEDVLDESEVACEPLSPIKQCIDVENSPDVRVPTRLVDVCTLMNEEFVCKAVHFNVMQAIQDSIIDLNSVPDDELTRL